MKLRSSEDNSNEPESNEPLIAPRPRFEFPFKLHKILEDADAQGLDSIISWHPDGKSFKVHDKEQLEKQVLPRYLHSPKYRSFQRQLSFYNFTFCRDPSSHRFRSYCHPLFIRGRPDLCKDMERRGNVSSKKSDDLEDSELIDIQPIPLYQAVRYRDRELLFSPETRRGLMNAFMPCRIPSGATSSSGSQPKRWR
eukprot:CAMPEP_0176052128 /NCGR_PEP_ID=MMETSP0120_2-20121206/25918_1 /TAXON_ID=160619 /ORGANISM="Kryptoperidinium foliaceum, Strain CCMP 1326" /LENGTH=194 /DNA_ID=CAMNT_0017385569 /DNA_START=550 /DNA_END=1134 /DNA_ORIENTATION=+